jgi:hypothetical protein
MGRRKSGLERLVGAFTSALVLGGLWYFHILPTPVTVMLGVFFVALPFLGGIRRSVRDIEDRRHARLEAREQKQAKVVEKKDSAEKTVLKIAKERSGVVTPALVALHSDLPLAEAERLLGDLAARGYAEMRIKDNGTIDYVFPDLQ